MKVTEFRIDFLSNFLSLDESRQKEAINNLSKDSAKLIELFKYATDQNANHLIDVKVIKSIFEKIEILDIDESLNESQIKDTVKLIKQIFPSQAESELKNIYDNFLIKHVDADNINLSNVFSYLKDAKRINATGTIAKCLQFIQNTMGVTLKVENSTLSIDIMDLKISWEELSSQIESLSNIYENQIAISYTAQASASPLAVKQFITKHGNLISSLDLQNLEDKVNDGLTKELIKSCPNIHHIFIKSTIISNDSLKELNHLTSLTSLDLIYCSDLTALPAKLPESLTSLNLTYCYGLKDLPAKLPESLTSLNLFNCYSLTALPANLPGSLTSLNLSNCSGLTALSAKLPGNLTSLNLSGCYNLKALPANLPGNLTSLNLSYCTGLKALPANLPVNLTSLNLSYCRELKDLPEKLPESLTSLNLSDCYGLTDLPVNLPESLTSLNLYNCRGLKDLPKKLPESLTSLDLSLCRGLTALPANLPVNLTSLNLFNCSGLTALPANLPGSLTSLDLTNCRGLKDLPANLPESLTSLNLSNCRGLTALPAKLPSSLTYLNLDGCYSLTAPEARDANLQILFSLLLSNSESGNAIQVSVAQFISDNQSELLLHDEHLLMQEAIEILSSNSIPGEKNPYSLFKKLKDLSQERTEFSPSMIEVEGVSVAILMPQLIEMARGSKINRSQLPKNVTKQVWDELFQALENKVKGSPVANEILKNLNSSWNEVSEAVPYLSGLLSLQGENVSDPEAQWRAILSSILEKNHAPRTDFYFTEQEEALITVLVGIGHCGPKKNEGILTNYLLLDPKYHYQIKPPKWRSAEKTKELEGKEAAINFIRKFIQPHEGKTIEEKVTLFKKFINNQEDIEKFHKNTAIILPFASAEDWDVFDVKNKKGETLWLTRLTDEGAISVLKAFTQEEDKQAAEERAAQFVTGIVKNLMDSQFASDNEIIQELTGINDMPQGVHQVLYMKNLIGHLVGVSRGPVFDRYTGVLYDHLLAIPRDEVLKIFFKHVTPERLIDEVVLVVNLNLKENRGLLAPLLQKGSSKDGSFTRQEAMSLLNQLDFLTTSPPLH